MTTAGLGLAARTLAAFLPDADLRLHVFLVVVMAYALLMNGRYPL